MDDGLCVPVTVIALQAGNVVTQVCYQPRARANARESALFLVSRARSARGRPRNRRRRRRKGLGQRRLPPLVIHSFFRRGLTRPPLPEPPLRDVR
jgi:hypothetical protein